MTARISPSVSPAPTHPSAPLHMLPPPSRGGGGARRHSHFSHLTPSPSAALGQPSSHLRRSLANQTITTISSIRSLNQVKLGSLVDSSRFISFQVLEETKKLFHHNNLSPPFITLSTWTKWIVTGLLIPVMCHNHLLLSGGVGNEKVIISAS